MKSTAVSASPPRARAAEARFRSSDCMSCAPPTCLLVVGLGAMIVPEIVSHSSRRAESSELLRRRLGARLLGLKYPLKCFPCDVRIRVEADLDGQSTGCRNGRPASFRQPLPRTS